MATSTQFQLCSKGCERPIDLGKKFQTCCRSCAMNTDPVCSHDALCDVRYHEYRNNKTHAKNTDSKQEEKSNDDDDLCPVSWQCVLCNWSNKSHDNQCIMCDKLRPNSKRKRHHSLLVCPDSTASPFHCCTKICCDRWGVSIDEPPKKKQKIEHHNDETEERDHTIWKCPLCTFKNNAIALQCKMCAVEINHTEEELLKRIKSQHEELKKTKHDLDALGSQNSASSNKQEIDDNDAIDDNECSDHESDDAVALDLFNDGLTPDVIKQKTNVLSSDCNHNKPSGNLSFGQFLKQSGFMFIEHDEEDRYIADMIAESALNEEDYWSAHNVAHTIPWIDAGDEIDQMMNGFDHGAIVAKEVNHKKTKHGAFGGYGAKDSHDGGGDDEIDENSVKRVNVGKEFRYAMNSGKVVRCRLIRRRQFDDFDDGDTHFRICESQFMRSCNRNTGCSSYGMQSTLKEVIYVINPKLITAFQAKKRKMRARLSTSGVNTILAWHGTPAQNIDDIVRNNFSLSHLSKNTGNRGCYGAGIYFSEYANVSQGYGDGLLLCKIMLGKAYQINSAAKVGCDKKKGYDSHMTGAGKYGTEIVIFDMDQILPCYIVKH